MIKRVYILLFLFGYGIVLQAQQPVSVAEQATVPPPLAALSCDVGQKIVIAVYPVESPDVADITKPSWSSCLSGFGLIGKAIDLAHSPIDDLTPEFRKAIREVLGPVDLQQLLITRAKQVIKPRTSCETDFLPTTWEKPAAFHPSDKIVVIGFYFIILGGRPTVRGYLSAVVMTGENATKLTERATELDRIMEEMKKLEPYVRATDKRPDLGKLKQYSALARQLGTGLTPYIKGAGTMNYKSPDHSTDEWITNDGAVIKQEITAVMDQLIGDVSTILFK